MPKRTRDGLCPGCGLRRKDLHAHQQVCSALIKGNEDTGRLGALLDTFLLKDANSDPIGDTFSTFGCNRPAYAYLHEVQKDRQLVDALREAHSQLDPGVWGTLMHAILNPAESGTELPSLSYLERRLGVNKFRLSNTRDNSPPKVSTPRGGYDGKRQKLNIPIVEMCETIFPASSSIAGARSVDKNGHPLHYSTSKKRAAKEIKAELAARGLTSPSTYTLEKTLPGFMRKEKHRTGLCNRCNLYYSAVTEVKRIFEQLHGEYGCVCACHNSGADWTENPDCLAGKHADCQGCHLFTHQKQVLWREQYFQKARWRVKVFERRTTTAQEFFAWFDKLRDNWRVHYAQKQMYSAFRHNLFANRTTKDHFLYVDPIQAHTPGAGDSAQMESFAQTTVGWLQVAAISDTLGKTARYYDFWHDQNKYSPESIAECVFQACGKENVKAGDTLWVLTDGDPKIFKTRRWVNLMRVLGKRLKVSLRILFACPGHGKCMCDSHAGAVKERLREMMIERNGSRTLKYHLVTAQEIIASSHLIGIEPTQHFAMPVPTADRYLAHPVKDVLRCWEVFCTPKDDSVFMRVHPCSCHHCSAIIRGGKLLPGQCAGERIPYVHNNAVTDQFVGMWLQRKAGYTTARVDDSDDDEE